MNTSYTPEQQERDLELSAAAEPMTYHFEPSRREVLAVLGAGILLTATASAWGQAGQGRGGNRGGAGGGRGGLEGGIGGSVPSNLRARLHIGKEGTVTVLCGKVECGQGVRAEVAQAAAEELRVPAARVGVILADTDLVPNDGPTVGSRSTPSTIPLVRQAASAARDVLAGIAARVLAAPVAEIEIRDGRAIHGPSRNEKTLAELAGAEDLDKVLASTATPRNMTVSAVAQWQVLGTSLLRPNAGEVVVGKHLYPSDIRRPGMVYGKVLRAPRYRTKATKVDVSAAKAMEGVTVVQDGDFVGVTAATSWAAAKALEAIKAEWVSEEHPDSENLAEYLVKNARVPANAFTAELGSAGNAAKVVKASYYLPYVQHAPMEPRAAVAEWNEGKLTVWTATQQPFGVRRSLAQAMRVGEDAVRVIVPDFGGGFGGKHTDECAVEAARLARAAGKPVHLRWTREEEFTWAYFRPAGVMQMEATLDASGRLSSWYHININSGPSAVQTPYAIGRNLCQTVNSAPPLRHGSYRGLAATANAWARECFMDECAAAARQDPVAFRLAHLRGAEVRVKDVLVEVAKRFDWEGRKARKGADVGIGIACATEKGSYTATAAQVTLDRASGEWKIDQITHVFECGKVINPYYCRQQVEGAIIQGLGPILREGMEFEGGRMVNGAFTSYRVPRFSDVPPMEMVLLDRPDLASAGAGETPLISVAPAVVNAVSMVAGKRVRELPVRV
jgi:isoquinoline 1-oxidoreductase